MHLASASGGPSSHNLVSNLFGVPRRHLTGPVMLVQYLKSR
jgi:hypothetical protein